MSAWFRSERSSGSVEASIQPVAGALLEEGHNGQKATKCNRESMLINELAELFQGLKCISSLQCKQVSSKTLRHDTYQESRPAHC